MMKKRTFLVLPITFATIVSMGMLAYGSWIIPFVDSTVGITVDKKSKMLLRIIISKTKKKTIVLMQNSLTWLQLLNPLIMQLKMDKLLMYIFILFQEVRYPSRTKPLL